MSAQPLTVEFNGEEVERLEILAQKYGYESVIDYIRDAVFDDDDDDFDDDDLDIDPVESFRRAWDDMLHGRVISFEEYMNAGRDKHDQD
jgi:hypothetical protein